VFAFGAVQPALLGFASRLVAPLLFHIDLIVGHVDEGSEFPGPVLFFLGGFQLVGLRLRLMHRRFFQRQTPARHKPFRCGQRVLALAFERAFLGQFQQVVESYLLVGCQLLGDGRLRRSIVAAMQAL